MTPRENFIRALERKPVQGHVPHFELVFFLTMEAFGRVHPNQRAYYQWNQMSDTERALHITDMARLYIEVAEKYDHSAIFVQPNPGGYDNTVALLTRIRELSADRYYLMMHGDPTYAIPNGEDMMAFAAWMVEEPEAVKKKAEEQLAQSIAFAQRLSSEHPGLLDGFTLCSDYCFNTNPFFSPAMFGEFVAPYLFRVIEAYRAMGFYTIKHTDGNIMPILEQLIQCNPHALHSLDPQGGVTIPAVRAVSKGRIALCGNVNCGLLQTGSIDECVEDVRRTLHQGMAEPGFIFCTSNCVYTGMPLERYELMLDIWRKEGQYPQTFNA